MLVSTSMEQRVGYLATATDEEAVVMVTYVDKKTKDKKTINNKSVSMRLKLET